MDMKYITFFLTHMHANSHVMIWLYLTLLCLQHSSFKSPKQARVLINLGLYENILPFLFLKQVFSTVKVCLQHATGCLH